MAVVIGELLVNLRASTAAFAKDLDKVTQLSFNSAKAIERSWNIIGTAMGAAVTAAVGGMVAGIEKTVEWEVHIGHLAQSAGTTTETMSGLSFAAKMMGLDIDQVAKAMERFDKQVASAGAGNKKAQQNMSILGVDVSTLKTSDEALMKLADHIAAMPEGIARTAAAGAAFGQKLGPSMVPLLLEGSKGIQEWMDQAKAMGLDITDQQFKAAETFEQNMTRMKEALHGLWVEITNYTIPVVNELMAKFADTSKVKGFWYAVMEGVASQTMGIKAYREAGAALIADQEKHRQALMDAAKASAAAAAATDAATKAQAAFEKSAEAIITSLKTQIATLGMNAEQIQVYKLRVDAAKLGVSAWAEAEIALYQKLQRRLNLLQEYAALEKSGKDAQNRNFLADQLKADQDDLEVLKQKADLAMRMASFPAFTAIGAPQQTQAFTEANDELVTSLQHSIDVWGKSAHWVTVYNLTLKDSSVSARAVAERTADMVDHLEHIQNVTAAWKTFGEVANRSLDDLIFSGKKFTDVLKDITRMIGEMILKWALLGVNGKGGLFGAIGAAIGIPGLAGGGPVGSGQPVMVGERGPELFVPAMSGRIVPNGAIGGGVTVNNYIDARGSSITEEQFARSLQAVESRAVQRAVNAGREMQLRTA